MLNKKAPIYIPPIIPRKDQRDPKIDLINAFGYCYICMRFIFFIFFLVKYGFFVFLFVCHPNALCYPLANFRLKRGVTE